MKKRLNKEKNDVNIKKGNKVLLFTKNFINDKLNNSYVKAFMIENVKNVTTLLTLSDIKTFSRFHISMLKKTSSSIFLISI